MKSFRLQFIDVNESIVINTTPSAIKGFMICRAPKGTTEATYFPFGSEKNINAMIGLQTANWPDIYEAVQFNSEYDLYISAPPGTSKDYPSYYGGVYLTKYGLHEFWRVDDKDNPNFEVQVYPAWEGGDFNSSYRDSEMAVSEVNKTAAEQGVITITNVDSRIISRMSYLTLGVWDDKATGLENGDEVRYHLSDGNIYAVVDDVDYKPAVGYYELVSDGSYTIVLGALKNAKATNTSANRGVPFLNLGKLVCSQLGSYLDLVDESKGMALSGIKTDGVDKTGAELISYLAYNGLSSAIRLTNSYTDGLNGEQVKEVVIGAFTGIKDRLYFNVNVKDDTFLVLSQKSPNETATSITISNIGYDKYRYDANVKYILKRDFEGSASTTESTAVAGIRKMAKGEGGEGYTGEYKDFIKDLIASNGDGVVAVVASTDALDWVNGNSNLLAFYQYDATSGKWADVTGNYRTKSIFVSGPLLNSTAGFTPYSDDTEVVNGYLSKTIWYVANVKKLDSYNHEVYQRKADGSYKLQSDINFNTVTLSCKEEVYPGQYTNGGEWTGSLYEKGKDASGSPNYFPNIVPEDTVTFINITPIHTFEELGCMDGGFFMEGVDGMKKIVDPIGPSIDTYTFTIVGQRFCKHVNDMNVEAGTLGCAWVDEYEAIINDGIIEAQQNMYDDALIFMEPTGQEVFKSKLMTLRVKYHDTSTVISPKIITKAEFNNPATITVSGRATGTAQYIGEFKMYDSYTGKYWWCQPIGDVGVNLARIMEKKLGGIAPAGTNDSQGLGGVLSRAVLAKKWDFNDDALEILATKNLNPITFDADNGLMMQDHRTTQDPADNSDWTYLGHSMSFDLCKREIRDKVMTPQLHKRVSDYYFNMREKQVQAILDKRTQGNDPIWSSASVQISGKNNASTMAQRKFMIEVRVKVYVYSDYVVLTFINEAQE